MDWTGCDLVESIPGKCSGRPVVRGTRIFADTIPGDYALGSPISEIQENYPAISLETIEALLAFARSHQETTA
jgi:uncharacterized protein (DUF433 family)